MRYLFTYPACGIENVECPEETWGLLPPRSFLEMTSGDFILHEQLWKPDRPNRPAGPYIPSDSKELRRFVKDCHELKKSCLVYTSPSYYIDHGSKSLECFVQSLHDLVEYFDLDGSYLDGLGKTEEIARERLQAIRAALGGVCLIAHVSNRGTEPVGQLWPDVEKEFLDGVSWGENVPFDGNYWQGLLGHSVPLIWIPWTAKTVLSRWSGLWNAIVANLDHAKPIQWCVPKWDGVAVKWELP